MHPSIRETVFDPVFDTQRCFRPLLHAMSRPGVVVPLPRLRLEAPWPSLHGALGLLLTLLDLEVTYAVLGPDPAVTGDVSDYLAANTGARPAPLPVADFVLALGSTGGEIAAAKVGALEAPDQGAIAVYVPDRLSGGAAGTLLRLTGPGVPGARILGVVGIEREELVLLAGLRAFPLGVDLVFAAADGTLAAIPRSTRVEVLL